jgi:hypothetical protein
MNARSRALDLPDYMFGPKFPKKQFLCVMVERISEYCGIKNKVYIIVIMFNELAKILTVTQNNERESIGFPGGRVIMDVEKCPEHNGREHAYLSRNENFQERKCMHCGFNDLRSFQLNTENERRFVWQGLKQWVGRYKEEIKHNCAETDTSAAVRVFKSETGMDFISEEHLFKCNIITIGMCKFYIYKCDNKDNKRSQNSSNATNEIKSVNHRGFDELSKLSSSGKMSNIHSQVFNYYLANAI